MADPVVIDRYGNTQTLAWAKAKYGPFVIYPAAEGRAAAWILTALQEKNDAALVCTAREETGEAAAGTRICFYWPDAPTLADAGPLGAPFDGITPNRAVSGYADANGNVGFGMGVGAHYFPENGERGPHAAWIHGANTRSDVILGLGMIPDDHLHLNPTWTYCAENGEDDDGDDEEPGPEGLATALAALADAIRQAGDALADVLEVIANG